MESDFTIRHELDSLNNDDPSIANLLNFYKTPPASFGNTQQPIGPQMFWNGLGQTNQNPIVSNQPGFQLSINQDSFRWIIVLGSILLILILCIIIFYVRDKKKNNVDTRLNGIEKKLRKLLKNKKGKKKIFDDISDPDIFNEKIKQDSVEEKV